MQVLAAAATLLSMAQSPVQQTRNLIERLRAHGHHAAADHLDRQLSLHGVECGLLFTLREACETVLTMVEAIDPVTQTMIEELRLEVESRLRLPDGSKEIEP
jgi:hypothetical protein